MINVLLVLTGIIVASAAFVVALREGFTLSNTFLLVFEATGPFPSDESDEIIMQGMSSLEELGFTTKGATITKGFSYTPGNYDPDVERFNANSLSADYVLVFPSKGPDPSAQSIEAVETAVAELEELGFTMKRIQIFRGYSYPMDEEYQM